MVWMVQPASTQAANTNADIIKSPFTLGLFLTIHLKNICLKVIPFS